MSFFAFVIFVVLILCVAWFYQWLKKVEGEIRAELAEEAETSEGTAQVTASATGPKEEPAAQPAAADEAEDTAAKPSAEDIVLDAIRAHPGIRQAEIYAHVQNLGKRRVQEIIRTLEKEGRIRRTRDRGSYMLETV
ncbi:MAG: hypothetical protein D6751_11450 [Deltaproteobacteria bacterium]|nr:MAG: hypothetical protein D6751_11450 [Deltaproteobacteria bacterium]